MADDHQLKDDPSKWPALGRALSWVDRPGSGTKLTIGLGIACAVVLLAELTYEAHPHAAPEHYFGFYAAYGFFMFIGLIFTAKALRVLAKRREDYYAPYVIDTEDYPDGELARESVDD